jgi:hypothetical protein
VSSGSFVNGNAVGKVYLKQPGVVTSRFTNPENMQRAGPTTIMATTGTGAVLSLTRQLSETYAKNIGSSRWGCENIWTLDLLTMLYLVEYANWDSQSLTYGIGQGIVNKSLDFGFNGEVNGYNSADTNITINGTGKGAGADGLTPVVYRGIENLWGNVWQHIIGLDALDSSYRILKRNGTGTPACPLAEGSYESTVAAPYTYDASLRPDSYSKDLLYEDLSKYLLVPNLGGGSSATYLCDYMWWHKSGQTNTWLAGGGWYLGAYRGFGCRYANGIASSSSRNVGARPEFL